MMARYSSSTAAPPPVTPTTRAATNATTATATCPPGYAAGKGWEYAEDHEEALLLVKAGVRPVALDGTAII